MSNTNVKKNKNENDSSSKKKSSFKFKMPPAIAILVIILAVLVVMSWILAWSGASYDDTKSIILPGNGFVSWNDINSTLGINVHNLGALNAILGGNILPNYDPSTPTSGGFELATNKDGLLGLFNHGSADYNVYVDGSSNVAALGIFGISLSIASGFTAGSDLIFYLFVLGAVIELMLVSGSMEAGIQGLVRGLNGKEIILIPLLFVLFSAGGTIYGMSEETVGLFVIVVPALCLAGFDAVTGMMVILGGTATGCAVSTVNPFSVGSANSAIGDAGVSNVMSYVLIFNLVWWVIMTAITCSMLTAYALYTRKNPEKSFQKQMKSESDAWVKEVAGSSSDVLKTTGRQRAALTIFMTAFALMILLFIPWEQLVGLKYSTGNKDPIFGLIATLGNWYFTELSMMFIFVGIVIALVLKMPMKTTTDAAWNGAKSMMSIAIVISVARGIPFILENTGMQPFLLGALTSSINTPNKWVFIYGMFIVLIVLSIFITSTSGLANAALPIMTSAAMTLFPDLAVQKEVMGGVMIAYMMGAGVLNFFTPTNPIVMASMQYSKVSYTDGFKIAFPMAMVVLVVTAALMLPSYILLMT